MFEKYTQQNRRAWEEIAEARYQAIGKPASFFRAGGCSLPECVKSAAGDVTGLSLLHLQCATGEDTLSWAALGARAIGVDISPRQVEIANALATESELPARFVAADVYALPDEIAGGQFDILFTGGGALVWLPDLPRWAQVVFAALKLGGRLILHEEHPVAGIFGVVGGHLTVEEDYFARGKAWEGAGWGHFNGAEGAVENKYEFAWPLGDVVTALAEAGLRIERLKEFSSTAEWRFGGLLEQVRGMPGEYLLLARKIG